MAKKKAGAGKVGRPRARKQWGQVRCHIRWPASCWRARRRGAEGRSATWRATMLAACAPDACAHGNTIAPLLAPRRPSPPGREPRGARCAAGYGGARSGGAGAARRGAAARGAAPKLEQAAALRRGPPPPLPLCAAALLAVAGLAAASAHGAGLSTLAAAAAAFSTLVYKTQPRQLAVRITCCRHAPPLTTAHNLARRRSPASHCARARSASSATPTSTASRSTTSGARSCGCQRWARAGVLWAVVVALSVWGMESGDADTCGCQRWARVGVYMTT